MSSAAAHTERKVRSSRMGEGNERIDDEEREEEEEDDDDDGDGDDGDDGDGKAGAGEAAFVEGDECEDEVEESV